MEAGARSVIGVVPIAIGIIPGYKVGGGHWRRREISYYKSVMEAGALPDCRRQEIAKSVTNK